MSKNRRISIGIAGVATLLSVEANISCTSESLNPEDTSIEMRIEVPDDYLEIKSKLDTDLEYVMTYSNQEALEIINEGKNILTSLRGQGLKNSDLYSTLSDQLREYSLMRANQIDWYFHEWEGPGHEISFGDEDKVFIGGGCTMSKQSEMQGLTNQEERQTSARLAECEKELRVFRYQTVMTHLEEGTAGSQIEELNMYKIQFLEEAQTLEGNN